jgi:hypothetical protein
MLGRDEPPHGPLAPNPLRPPLLTSQRIGLPCGLAPPASSAPEAPELPPSARVALERWPLLQAYGLEGVGRPGFFTLSTQVGA